MTKCIFQIKNYKVSLEVNVWRMPYLAIPKRRLCSGGVLKLRTWKWEILTSKYNWNAPYCRPIEVSREIMVVFRRSAIGFSHLNMLAQG